jgi:hypothetical protein
VSWFLPFGSTGFGGSRASHDNKRDTQGEGLPYEAVPDGARPAPLGSEDPLERKPDVTFTPEADALEQRAAKIRAVKR